MQLDDMKAPIRGDDYLCYMAAVLFVEIKELWDGNIRDNAVLSVMGKKIVEWEGCIQLSAINKAKEAIKQNTQTIATKVENVLQYKVDSSGEQS